MEPALGHGGRRRIGALAAARSFNAARGARWRCWGADATSGHLHKLEAGPADGAARPARSTRSGGTSRIKERDLLFVLRKDRKRLHRVLELLEVFEEQKQARGNQQPEELARAEAEDEEKRKKQAKSLDKPDA